MKLANNRECIAAERAKRAEPATTPLVEQALRGERQARGMALMFGDGG